MKKIDLTGQRFGRLQVIEKDCLRGKGNTKWICLCDCGEYTVCRSDHLTNGFTRSCGCLSRERATKHKKCNTRLYGIWLTMKDRCHNPNRKSYKDYGGRGIMVCDEWKNDFQTFYDWSMENGYRDDLSIDRIDSNGNYEPGNCRWATLIEQANNTRRNRFLTYNGETHSMSEWSRITGISRSTLQHRLVNGWTVERMLTEKPKNN